MINPQEETRVNPSLTPQEERAWTLLCNETAGDMHIFDFWHEVPQHVKEMYLTKSASVPDTQNYTISEPEEVECPYCGKENWLTDDIADSQGKLQSAQCDSCKKTFDVELEYSVNVIATTRKEI